MRKQTKLALGLAAAALLAVGASMTSFAARGWVAEGDQWYYYDNSGDYVTDKWKSYNGNYFYLGDEGYMLTNELIEDGNNWYYVDANGAMVKNTWVAIPSDEDEDLDVEYRWYYFGANGKAFKSADKKTINGKKYGFDDDAKMLFGFVRDRQVLDGDDPILECDHYYGSNDDGAMYTGWLLYQDAIDGRGDDYEDQFYWFWFDSKGVKFYNDGTGSKPGIKKINGKQYYFNSDGAMQYEWNDATFDTANGATWGFFSAAEDGHLVKSSWIWTTADGNDDKGFLGDDDDEHWFYADKHGVLYRSVVKKINGKYYSFDENGVMLTGFVWLSDASIKKTNDGLTAADQIDPDSISEEDLYKEATNFAFFSVDEERDGSAKTGTSIKIELYDDTYTFGFDKTTGIALHGLSKNKVYDHGILQTAGSDKYKKVTVDGEEYLVGTSGTRMKPGKRTYKDDDDYFWGVAKSGKVVGPYAEKNDVIAELGY